MANKPQNFSTDHIMTQLVAYFNALPAGQRIIGPTAVPFYNIKVITGPNGQAVIVAGDAAKDVDASAYLGEATFTWVGPRHATNPQTATAARFFEVSKYVNQSGGTTLTFRNDVITYNGEAVAAPVPEVDLPTDGDYTYYLVMTDQYGDGWNGGSINLSINSVVYELGGPTTTTKTVSFGAFDGDTIQVVIGNHGEYPEEMQVQLYQVDHGQPMSDASQVVVRSESTGIPTDSTPFINFVAPFSAGNTVAWALSQVITPSPQQQYANFGQSAAMNADGTVLVVGAPGYDKQGTYDQGQVFIYNLDSSTAEPTLFQIISRSAVNYNVGYNVDISGDGAYMAIAYGASSGNSAFVWVYGRTDPLSQFTLLNTITHTAYTAQPPIVKFGANNKLFVSSGNGGPSGTSLQGQVSLYRRITTTSWATTPDTTWYSDAPADFALFGYQFAVSENGNQFAVVEFRRGGSSSTISAIHHYLSINDGTSYTRTATFSPGELVRSVSMFAEGKGIAFGTDTTGTRLWLADDDGKTNWAEYFIWNGDNSYIAAAQYDPVLVAIDKASGNVTTHTIDLLTNTTTDVIISNLFADANQVTCPVMFADGPKQIIAIGQGGAFSLYQSAGNVILGSKQ